VTSQVAKWSEESVVDLIRESFTGCLAEGARDLIDDGAWLPKVSAYATRVISCDAFQEGNDFLLHLSPVQSAGYRAVVQNISDLAAMGAAPVGFVWSLEVPALWLKARGALLSEFCDGAAKACRMYDLRFYGGDLSFSSDRFGCTITILGDVEGKPHSRRGAKPGDVIYVSRPLGLSSFGLSVLFEKLGARKQTMSEAKFEVFLSKLSQEKNSGVKTHLWPEAEIKLAQKLLGSATACMDISDGLGRDLYRLCNASKVGAELDNLKAAFHPDLPGAKAYEYAIHGGEEFALLFTAPPKFKAPKRCVRIGKVTSKLGIYELDGTQRKKIAPKGYDHFTSRT
jgi:thiamine-monophosphate kinase